MEARNKEILRNFVREVWTEGKVDAADEYLAPRYTIHHDPGDPWDGKALDLVGFKERVRKSRAPFPDQRFVISELIAEPNRVVATWHWTGTHTGDIPGFPASGKAISTSGITVYYFDGEMITGHWQISDRSGVHRQLSQ